MGPLNGVQPAVDCVGVHPIGRAEGVAIPVMIVPIIYRLAKYPRVVLKWPQRLYLQYKGPLCRQHAYAFTMRDYEEYICGDSSVGSAGGWYEMVGDHLRSRRKPATNPFPPCNKQLCKDPAHFLFGQHYEWEGFEWEAWVINPNWEPAPKEECTLEMWDVAVLRAKGMSQRLW